MKINKIRLITTGIIVVAVVGFIVSLFTGGKKFELQIKEMDSINKIVSEKSGSTGRLEVSGKDIINGVIKLIQADGRKTKTKSVNDNPNVDSYYIITFVNTNQKIYIYNKNKKYYIEEPYNGIYKISEEEYNSIIEYISFN